MHIPTAFGITLLDNGVKLTSFPPPDLSSPLVATLVPLRCLQSCVCHDMGATVRISNAEL